MRLSAPLVCVLGLLAAGCGGGGAPEPAAPGTLRAFLDRDGENVALVPGALDFGPGEVRYPFLVVASDGRSVERARAEVWVGRSLESEPLLKAEATLEDVGVPGTSEHAAGDVSVRSLTSSMRCGSASSPRRSASSTSRSTRTTCPRRGSTAG